MRDFQKPGRSAIRAMSGMAATSHPLSTLAALDVLREGGTAMDAAICASAVQTVVEPQSTGIGGDCFALYCRSGTDDVIALNGSGRAPGAASITAFRALGMTEVPTFGPHSVTIPGAIDAWFRLSADHGKLPMARLLEPAIAYAAQGYVVHDRVASDWAAAAGRLAGDPHSARIFLNEGNPYRTGEVHRQPELARTLKTIADQGRSGFYEGGVRDAMVARLNALGGLHAAEDFTATACEYVTPVSADYRGYRVHQVPPNNQGLTALLMLNILSGYDLATLDPGGPERLHLEVEAARLAYGERNARMGDGESTSPVVAALLSDAHTDLMRRQINTERAMTHLPSLDLASSDTVYITVVDKDRNTVSFINSTYHSFGSTITCPETGVVLQNRGASFRMDPDHPNALAPGKRPMHTIMPGMVTRGGRAVMPFGVMGGDYQPMGHAHLLSNVLDYGMDLQQAVDHPRAFIRQDTVQAERGVPADTIAGLQSRGHTVTLSPEPLGGAQAIWIDWENGTLTGASDPRKDGCAMGY